jgi:hypothetical protein
MNTLKQIAEKYKRAADELTVRISHLQAVSQDTAYREGFNLEALRRAQSAAETDKVFLGGEAKGVLVLGISTLGPEKAEKSIASCSAWKSHANSTLLLLDGEQGEIRKNKAGTCWVIDLASPRRTVMFGWSSGPHEMRFAGPRLNITNGAAHWCGLISAMTPYNADKSPNTVAFLQRATECLVEHGMTPRQRAKHQAEQETACRERYAQVVSAAVEAGKVDDVTVCVGFGYNPTRGGEYIETAQQIAGESGPVPENLAVLVREKIIAVKLAAEDARIIAELEAEQARFAEEKAKAEAKAKQQAEIATTCRMVGISPEQWRGMTEKHQRLAFHRARLAGKI